MPQALLHLTLPYQHISNPFHPILAHTVVLAATALAHHLSPVRFKMNLTSSQCMGLLGKEKLVWLDQQEEISHESFDCHHPREKHIVQRASTPVAWVCVPLEGYCFLLFNLFVRKKKMKNSLVSCIIFRLLGNQYFGDGDTSCLLNLPGNASYTASEIHRENRIL